LSGFRGERRQAALAFAAALAAVAAVIAAQPLGAPWWLYADADATYTATGIDLMAAEHTFYLDHPGMPLQDLMAMTVEVRYVLHKLTHEHATPHAYAAQRLLNLDDSRIFFRGYAILFYAGGALFAFFALWRLLGSPWWGTAGTLLFLCAPGLQEMSIQFRPDGLLAGLVLAVGYLIVRAAERRDAWSYTLAALLLGLTMTVKIHAAALLLPFGIALLVRPPTRDGAALRDAALTSIRRHRVTLAAFAAVWLTFCVTFDRNRFPFSASHDQKVAVAEIVVAFVGYALLLALVRWLPGVRRLARGPLRPLGLVLTGAFLAGVLLPGTLVINDLPEMLVKMIDSLTGGGVNSGVSRFSIDWSTLVHTPLVQGVVLLVLAAAASAYGLLRRELEPLLWFSGAAVAFAMAAARLGAAHYFAPAFVLCIPPALWLARRLPGTVAAGAAVVLVLAVAVPDARHLLDQRHAATYLERQSAAIESLSRRFVTAPGTVALSEDYAAPVTDVRWLDLVQNFVAWVPPYPYRILPDSAYGLRVAEQDHLVPTYYVGWLPYQLSGRATVPLGFGTYVIQPLHRLDDAGVGIGVGRLVSGPGVDRPIGHPDAPYDPWTGYYKDPAGRYWDLAGNAIVNPAKRRYLARRRLWVDAYGDLWSATGRHVGHRRG
jgi:hypothetical protein